MECEMDFTDYISQGGVRCPYCGGEQVHSSLTDFDELWVYFYTGCHECKKTWTDVYKLTEVTEHEETE